MKTTIDISEPLLRAARQRAARDGTTLRSLVELGLRQVLSEEARTERYQWQPVISGGRGLRPELKDALWKEIRDLSYERGVE
jgi:hypothetical protein